MLEHSVEHPAAHEWKHEFPVSYSTCHSDFPGFAKDLRF